MNAFLCREYVFLASFATLHCPAAGLGHQDICNILLIAIQGHTTSWALRFGTKRHLGIDLCTKLHAGFS